MRWFWQNHMIKILWYRFVDWCFQLSKPEAWRISLLDALSVFCCVHTPVARIGFQKPEKHPSTRLRVKHQTNHSDFLCGGGTISIQWWDDPKIFELKKPTSEIGSSLYKRVFFWTSHLVSGFTLLHGMPPNAFQIQKMQHLTWTDNGWTIGFFVRPWQTSLGLLWVMSHSHCRCHHIFANSMPALWQYAIETFVV